MYTRRRLLQLYLGLALFGVSDGMILLAGLGVDPWDVFHQGLALHTGLAVGTWAIIVGAVVLLLWIPLRQKPGLGTISNVVVVGAGINAVLWLVPTPHNLAVRVVLLLSGVALNGVATGAYIGAGLGPGPRDGIMTGLAARGHSLRLVRTAIEVGVLVAGWLLGGNLGVGTVVYAFAIGPLAQVFVPRLTIPRPCSASGRPEATGDHLRAATESPSRDSAGDRTAGQRDPPERGGPATEAELAGPTCQ